MSSPTTDEPGRSAMPTAAPILLWFGFLGAPIAWLVHLGAATALVPVACENGAIALVHLTTVLTGVVAIAAIVVARRNRHATAERERYAFFLGEAGLWLGALFLALIVLEGLPVFFLDPCD